MNLFFDSSALAKRYIQEPGSERVAELMSGASSLGLSIVCLSEVISALCRCRREKKLSRQQYLTTKRTLFEDAEDANIVRITDEVMARVVELLEGWPLRSADSIQVASAVEWGADLFVSADVKQCDAARGYGLKVEKLPAGL